MALETQLDVYFDIIENIRDKNLKQRLIRKIVANYTDDEIATLIYESASEDFKAKYINDEMNKLVIFDD